MPQQRADAFIRGSRLSHIHRRALRLAALNRCLERQLPLAVDTIVKLANIDRRGRAVVHVRGDAWAAQVRLQQRLIITILRSCGGDEITGMVVKNRPLAGLAEIEMQPKAVRRPLSPASRDLIAAVARGIGHPPLAAALRRFARRR